ncbi:MAG: hypothetical protein M1833_004254 [Piccolia ochrophora]|nr:MAG: hypothetical protein M1833_004254 [Piccolia ochrophora]
MHFCIVTLSAALVFSIAVGHVQASGLKLGKLGRNRFKRQQSPQLVGVASDLIKVFGTCGDLDLSAQYVQCDKASEDCKSTLNTLTTFAFNGTVNDAFLCPLPTTPQLDTYSLYNGLCGKFNPVCCPPSSVATVTVTVTPSISNYYSSPVTTSPSALSTSDYAGSRSSGIDLSTLVDGPSTSSPYDGSSAAEQIASSSASNFGASTGGSNSVPTSTLESSVGNSYRASTKRGRDEYLAPSDLESSLTVPYQTSSVFDYDTSSDNASPSVSGNPSESLEGGYASISETPNVPASSLPSGYRYVSSRSDSVIDPSQAPYFASSSTLGYSIVSSAVEDPASTSMSAPPSSPLASATSLGSRTRAYYAGSSRVGFYSRSTAPIDGSGPSNSVSDLTPEPSRSGRNTFGDYSSYWIPSYGVSSAGASSSSSGSVVSTPTVRPDLSCSYVDVPDFLATFDDVNASTQSSQGELRDYYGITLQDTEIVDASNFTTESPPSAPNVITLDPGATIFFYPSQPCKTFSIKYLFGICDRVMDGPSSYTIDFQCTTKNGNPSDFSMEFGVLEYYFVDLQDVWAIDLIVCAITAQPGDSLNQRCYLDDIAFAKGNPTGLPTGGVSSSIQFTPVLTDTNLATNTPLPTSSAVSSSLIVASSSIASSVTASSGAASSSAASSSASGSGAPSTDAPSTDTPSIDAPSTVGPRRSAANSGAPSSGAPSSGTSSSGAPNPGAPSSDAPIPVGPSSGAASSGAASLGAPSTDAPSPVLPSSGAANSGTLGSITSSLVTNIPQSPIPDPSCSYSDVPATEVQFEDADLDSNDYQGFTFTRTQVVDWSIQPPPAPSVGADNEGVSIEPPSGTKAIAVGPGLVGLQVYPRQPCKTFTIKSFYVRCDGVPNAGTEFDLNVECTTKTGSPSITIPFFEGYAFRFIDLSGLLADDLISCTIGLFTDLPTNRCYMDNIDFSKSNRTASISPPLTIASSSALPPSVAPGSPRPSLIETVVSSGPSVPTVIRGSSNYDDFVTEPSRTSISCSSSVLLSWIDSTSNGAASSTFYPEFSTTLDTMQSASFATVVSTVTSTSISSGSPSSAPAFGPPAKPSADPSCTYTDVPNILTGFEEGCAISTWLWNLQGMTFVPNKAVVPPPSTFGSLSMLSPCAWELYQQDTLEFYPAEACKVFTLRSFKAVCFDVNDTPDRSGPDTSSPTLPDFQLELHCETKTGAKIDFNASVSSRVYTIVETPQLYDLVSCTIPSPDPSRVAACFFDDFDLRK